MALTGREHGVRLRRPPSGEGGRLVRSSFSFQSYGSITIVQLYVPGFKPCVPLAVT